MGLDHLLSVAAFCFAGSMTPGPNNVMLLASGVNYGFARTLPHLAGVVGGYCFLLLVIGSGLGNLFAAFPAAHTALKIVGGLYLLWLAWKIATAAPASGKGEAGRPFTFLEAAAFQWVNVKGVLLGVSAVAAFTRPDAFAPRWPCSWRSRRWRRACRRRPGRCLGRGSAGGCRSRTSCGRSTSGWRRCSRPRSGRCWPADGLRRPAAGGVRQTPFDGRRFAP